MIRPEGVASNVHGGQNSARLPWRVCDTSSVGLQPHAYRVANENDCREITSNPTACVSVPQEHGYIIL